MDPPPALEELTSEIKLFLVGFQKIGRENSEVYLTLTNGVYSDGGAELPMVTFTL